MKGHYMNPRRQMGKTPPMQMRIRTRAMILGDTFPGGSSGQGQRNQGLWAPDSRANWETYSGRVNLKIDQPKPRFFLVQPTEKRVGLNLHTGAESPPRPVSQK